jgi:trypsin
MKIALPSILFALLETAALAQNHGGGNLRNVKKEEVVPAAAMKKEKAKAVPAAAMKEKAVPPAAAMKEKAVPPANGVTSPAHVVQSFSLGGNSNAKKQKQKQMEAPEPGHVQMFNLGSNESTDNNNKKHKDAHHPSPDQQRALNEKKKRVAPANDVNMKKNYHTSIVGGEQSDVGEFPYFVDLNGCGGSLIAPNIVLTAAHCDPSGSSFVNANALVGAYERQQETYGAEFVNIAAQRVHPQYNDFTLANDFQLLRLSEDVISATPVTLSLDDDYSPADGADLTVLGVGLTTQGGFELPPFLSDVDVQVVNIDECNTSYNNEVIEDVMFCAGVPQGGKDSCQGDSGGPIVKRIGNEHVQVGVVSWGYGCAQPGFPGIYSRVSSAHDWIKQVVCEEWGESASFCDGGSPPTGGNCAAGELDFDFSITTDSYGYETSWELANSQNQVVVSGENLDSDLAYNTRQCIPNDAYTLTIYDSYGDGLCCGSNPGYTLAVDGNGIQQGGADDFGGEISVNFGSTPTGGSGNCATGELDFDFSITTDYYGYETSWEVVNSHGQSVVHGENLDSDLAYNTRQCIPNDSYTLMIYDSYGDGLCCGTNPGYTLAVDGNVIQQGGADDFGGEISVNFGSTASCVELQLDLLTDAWGYETEVWLVNDATQEWLWYDYGFANNESRQYTACLDPTGCATLQIFDSYGDGINAPDGITLQFGDELVYQGGDFGYGEVFRFGSGCLSSRGIF